MSSKMSTQGQRAQPRRRRRPSLHHWYHMTHTPCRSTHTYTLTGRQTETHNHQYCPWQRRTRTKSSRNKNKTVVYGVLNNIHSTRRCLCDLSRQLMLFTAAATPQFDSPSLPLRHFEENAPIYKADGENGVLLKGRNARNQQFMFMQPCDPIPSIRCGREANERGRGNKLRRHTQYPCVNSRCISLHI